MDQLPEQKLEDDGESRQLSSRGKAAVAPSIPYLNSYFKCLENPIHPVTNPTGYIALCVAESKLPCKKFLAERLSRPSLVEHLFDDDCSLSPEMGKGNTTAMMTRTTRRPSVAERVFEEEDSYNYGDFRGLRQVREGVARFLERFFLNLGNLEKLSIDPHHICLGSGASSVLGNLFYTLAEAGDAVLIPAPYYNAFENDMKQFASLVPVPVYMEDCTLGPTIEELETAAKTAEESGLTVKILLITNPNNPLGVIYKPNVILNSVMWARSRKMHIIADELYALSVHDVSSELANRLQLLNNSLGNDVHFVWGLSKDFASSGFRVGVLYSQNRDLLKAFGTLSIFCCVPFPMQLITLDLLNDTPFVLEFLELSRQNLVDSKRICTSKLQQLSLPYVEAEAGIFLYVDFSSLLPLECTFEHEAQFASLMESTARLVMTPGVSQREKRPGWFRICYAWVSPEVLQIAMGRIEFMVNKLRYVGLGWYSNSEILNDELLADVLLVN